MINLEKVRDAIEEIEEKGVTFQNCERLAALYTIVDYRLNKVSDVVQEYSDILPSYQLYCRIKKKYELKEVTEEAVKVATKSLCEEIRDFLMVIYSNTNTELERKELRKMLSSLTFN